MVLKKYTRFVPQLLGYQDLVWNADRMGGVATLCVYYSHYSDWLSERNPLVCIVSKRVHMTTEIDYSQ